MAMMESGYGLARTLPSGARWQAATFDRELSQPRVGCGIGESWFLVLMVRLVLFACLGLGTLHAQTIRPDDLAVLMAAAAVHKGSIKTADLGPGKVGWVESWDSSSSLSWTGKISVPGSYAVFAILQGSGGGCLVEVTISSKPLTASCLKTDWERVKLGTVELSAPAESFTFRSVGTSPVAKVFSLEIVKPEVQVALADQAARGSARTDWMVHAKYGVMVHWTSQSKPERGSPLAYCEAVRSFDVHKFADVLDEMGAGYVVFTTSHAEFYFPGPNKVIDEILPGRTCSRDLVGDLAQALSKRGIRLELYFHPGHDDIEWWRRTHFDDDKEKYFDLWCRAIREIGQQYGPSITGYWFDDAAFTYYPFNAPWAKMTAAAKQGNPNRLVCYNSWILPKVNDFYEVFAGENDFSAEMIHGFGFLPVGGTGKFTGGPQSGLQGQITTIINGDWGHFKVNTPIAPPRYSAAVTIAKIRDAISRGNVPTFDVEVYQDGRISPETLGLFKEVRRAIKPTKTE
jgi:hypothetical protein